MQKSFLKKAIVFAVIVIFIGISFFPFIGRIPSNSLTVQSIGKIESWLLPTVPANNEHEGIEKVSLSNGWVQVIGDYPNGRMDNGFNNSYNVAIRGKTTFTIDDVEYLLVGTGNVISDPFGPKMITAVLTKFKAIGILSFNQFILNFVVRLIENYFKDVETQGCELWYYDDLSWKQSVGNDSINATIEHGFGNINNMELTMLHPYNPPSYDYAYLYAGTFNPREGCEIWRTTNPIEGPWEPLIHKNGEGTFSSGFGNRNNHAAYSAAVFDEWLYIGTMNWRDGFEIWRTNGVVWEKVVGGGCDISYGFGDDSIGFERDIYAWEMMVFEDSVSNQEYLYVGTFNIAGCELWRTSDGNTWTCLVGKNGELKRGFNMAGTPLRTHNYGIRRMEVFKNSLYIGTASVPPFGLKINGKNRFFTNIFLESMGTGCEIWRFNGSSFTRVIGRKFSIDKNKHSGFGDWTNAYIWSLRAYDDRLFAGTWNPGRFLTNITFKLAYPAFNFSIKTEKSQHTYSAGCEVWFTEDGDNWYQMVGEEVHKKSSQWPRNGFGDDNNIGARALIPFKNCLYLGITNTVDGCELWKFDGSSYPSKPTSSINDKFM
ncbi:MAG: hypothetical protein JSW60_02855 [Thermoplasmatales archaeon]|nr:MAG: hypothetical protein JSW60_02855 [Thermoplasmatales archaeon]